MDAVTHALASIALDRAGLRRVSPSAMLVLVISGVAADLDLLSYFGGAGAYFHYHFTLLHSLIGSAILAIVIAAAFWFAGRKRKAAPLRFAPVLLLCAVGAGAHLLLDFLGAEGVQLFWPFRNRWFSLDFLPEIDPWIIGVLLAGLLLPSLFRMVSEEIGERKRKRGFSRGAVAALALMTIYVAGRALLHRTAVQMLMSHDYHGAAPLVAGAFPDSASPLFWRGVVATTDTIEEIDVPATAGDSFDAASSLSHYKPPSSPALDVARQAPLAAQFLRYARFPVADLQTIPNGWLITLRDLRFPQDSESIANMHVVIEVSGDLRLRDQYVEFSTPAK